MTHVLVLGAGVSGLLTGLTLIDKGYTVEIWAKDLKPNASMNAAAFWYPFHTAAADNARIGTWAAETHNYLREVSNDEASGVTLRKFVELKRQHADLPWWSGNGPAVRKADKSEIPSHYSDALIVNELPILTPHKFLAWLRGLFVKKGGSIIEHTVASLDEAFAHCRIVINCTALGARALSGEMQMYPVRGQVVRIKHKGIATTALLDSDDEKDIAYIVPHGDGDSVQDYVLLGGTYERNATSTTPDALEVLRIIERCKQLLPELVVAQDDIINTSCGLRPCRPSVLVESRIHSNGIEILNVGHGGAGFTISKGCASEVARLVDQCVSNNQVIRKQHLSIA